MRILSDYKVYLGDRLSTLNSNQTLYFNKMLTEQRMTLCIPTGAGKGYLMITHLLNQIITTKQDLFLTLSHRLTLNTQHLNDIVDAFDPMLGTVGFIFVGSNPYTNIYDKYNRTPNADLTPEQLKTKIRFNTYCLHNKVNSQELFTSTLNQDVLKDTIDKHRIAGRKIIIVSTYHSVNIIGAANIPIDVAYCDEAHTMATDLFSDGVNFYNSYIKLIIKQSIFMTATPKDCDDPSISNQSALMNNAFIYGVRIGMSFKEAIEEGYVVKPIIHTSCLRDGFVDKDINMPSVCRFVRNSFEEHCQWVKSVSVSPDNINGKLLIKCESVKMMWAVARYLIDNVTDITVCCGASIEERDSDNIAIGDKHRINYEYINKREDYLLRLQAFTDNQRVIVLHFDTLSEGINISSFTGVMFLTPNLPSKPKILQNTGRSTRLNPIDRDRLRQGLIKINEYGTWIKPHCAIIIPYWDRVGEVVMKTIVETIVSLREDYGFKSGTDFGLGNEMGIGSNEMPREYLNSSKWYKEGSIDLGAHTINQVVEDLYIAYKETLENEKLKKMSNEDWFLHNFQ